MTQPYGHDPYGQQPPSQPYQTHPSGYGYPPPPPPRKRSSAPVVLVVIGALVLLLFGGCAAIVAAIGSSGDTSRVTTGRIAESDDPADEPTARKKTREKQAGIGTAVRDGEFSFTVTKMDKRARVGGDFLSKDAQGVFLLVYITVENIGDEAQAFSGSAQKLYDAKGREFEASAEAAIYLQDSKSLYEKINPGNSVRGVVLFDIPKNTDPAAIELHDSIFSNGVKVKL